MEPIRSSETSSTKNQRPGNRPKKNNLQIIYCVSVHSENNLKKFIQRDFPYKRICRIHYTPHVLRYWFLRHKSRQMRPHFPTVTFITTINCTVRCTEETHCSAVHSCDLMTIKYTRDGNWDVLLTLGAAMFESLLVLVNTSTVGLAGHLDDILDA